MKDDLQKSDSCGLKSERKKILTSSTCSLACLSTNLGAFCPMVVHLPSEKSILPYFSGPRGVAILDCDSHSQAGSTNLHVASIAELDNSFAVEKSVLVSAASVAELLLKGEVLTDFFCLRSLKPSQRRGQARSRSWVLRTKCRFGGLLPIILDED